MFSNHSIEAPTAWLLNCAYVISSTISDFRAMFSLGFIKHDTSDQVTRKTCEWISLLPLKQTIKKKERLLKYAEYTVDLQAMPWQC